MMMRRGRIVWFVGLSGAGKSTLCRSIHEALRQRGEHAVILDGDELRRGLCSDLGFNDEDRTENIRRATYVADLIANAETTVLLATISPLQHLRDFARSILPDMIEIFVDAPLTTCERRDPKGLYTKARAGQLSDFTGVTSPFEVPRNPDLICYTDTETVQKCLLKILAHLDAAPREISIRQD